MYQVEFFTTASNKSPIIDFILNLPTESQTKIRLCLNLLKEYGLQVREPHSKKLSGYKNLFELRTSGKSPIRLIYTYSQNKFIILNGFRKKINKTPQKEIKIATSRML